MKRKRMKDICKLTISFLMIICLIFDIAAAEEAQNGYQKPEEAILCFFAGLQEQDLGIILGAFPRETENKTTLRNAMLKIGAYYDGMWPSFPNDDGILSAINDMLLLGERTELISNVMLLYTYPDKSTETSYMHLRVSSIKTAEDADALLSTFDLDRLTELSGITNIRILSADEATGGSYSARKQTQKSLDGMRSMYGADEVKEMAVYFSLDGYEYVMAPTLGKYGDRWYMITLYGSMCNMLGIEIDGSGIFRLLGETDAANKPAVFPQQSAVSLSRTETGGATPEEAALLYLEGLKTGDADKMLNAYAWESMNRNTSFTLSVRQKGFYNSKSWPLFPQDGGLLDELNLALLVNRRTETLRRSFLYFVTEGKLADNEEMLKYRTIRVRNDEDADVLLNYFDLNRMNLLGTISDIRFCTPGEMADVYESTAVKRTREAYRQMYGADELTDLAVFFTVGGEEYVIMPQFVRYGDRWYISDMTGVLASIFGISVDNAALCPVALGK